jgi:hypothetical protein
MNSWVAISGLEASFHLEGQVDWDGGAAGQRLQRRAQAAVGKDGRMQAAGDLSQLLQRAGQAGSQTVQPLHQLTGPGGRRRLRGPQFQGKGHQALLGAVVQLQGLALGDRFWREGGSIGPACG